MKLGVAAQRPVRTMAPDGKAEGVWFTPTPTAHELAAWLGLDRGDFVVDAGAGRGMLALAAWSRGARVTMVEIDPQLAAACRELDIGAVHHADFLGFTVPFGRDPSIVVSNPVWEGDVAERFALHGLELAPRVGLITPLNIVCGGERAERFWQSDRVCPTRARALASRPRFGGATGGMRDVVFLELRRGRPNRTRDGKVLVPLEVG